MESKLNINRNEKYKFNFEPTNENNINEELETKWKEIDELTQQKIQNNKESRKLNCLNNFAIMRINLNSLIHPMDDSSEFENYCNIKMKQLDKMLNSFENDSKYNSNLISFSSNNNERKYNNDNNIKSFLKSDDNIEIENQLFSRYTLDEIIEINKNKKSKKKIDINQFFDDAINNNSNNNKTFTYHSKNKFDYEDDTYTKKLDQFANKLNEIKNTFLKKDKNYITTGNNNLLSSREKNSYNKYKSDFPNEYDFGGYNTSKNKTINTNGIRNKIEDGYNYFYGLYPNLRKK